MPKPVAVINVRGVKCDNPACTFKEPAAEFSRFWIGIPCPLCGRSLLTFKDYLCVRLITAALKVINAITRAAPEDAKYRKIRIHLNGSGIPSGFEVDPKEEKQ